MRKLSCLFICFVFVLLFGLWIPVSATEGPQTTQPVDLSGIMMELNEQEEFNELVGNNESTIESVILAAEHKNRDVSFEGVHAAECVILHGLKRTGDSMVDAYLKNGKIESTIGDDYAVMTIYLNETGEYVDSFVFVNNGNPDEFNLNGWVELCSGSGMLDDDKICYFSDGTINDTLEDLGLRNVKKLKIISYIPELGFCIFFEQENEEFLIPFQDESAEIKALQVYKVSDIIENYLIPIREFNDKWYEEYKAQWRERMIEEGLNPDEMKDPIPAGANKIPDDLLSPLLPVDLNTYFNKTEAFESVTNEPKKTTTVISELELTQNHSTGYKPTASELINENNARIICIISFATILLLCGIIGIIVLRKRKSNKV